MEFKYADGRNKDFILLCEMLDDYLNEIVGGEKQRNQYAQYNTLEKIHDVVLVYDGVLPIACAGLKYYKAGVAEVKRVFLREEYRGKGISILLLSALEKKAKEKGYHSLILETGKPLKAAMGLYQKTGFEMIDNYGPYKNMADSVCMQKTIL
ncbi:GNAT family N-acetyltransferase [Caproiciproducens sp. NJN-50]|uniref:GNAT family N-acetyltransferase n=1 Tax=Acutalibacteraceae TaxID=3082771 RepID=UPI000FFE2EDB|nr:MULTISPECIES: GNAT family N-acetyltransferase [Acutalibacteraceae]QAT50154.1 GNAT family N-acetyltransferase [Caproiciproducens sp. NJN-50]